MVAGHSKRKMHCNITHSALRFSWCSPSPIKDDTSVAKHIWHSKCPRLSFSKIIYLEDLYSTFFFFFTNLEAQDGFIKEGIQTVTVKYSKNHNNCRLKTTATSR